MGVGEQELGDYLRREEPFPGGQGEVHGGRVQRQVGWQQSSRVGCSWGPGRLSCMCFLDWESQASRDARGWIVGNSEHVLCQD